MKSIKIIVKRLKIGKILEIFLIFFHTSSNFPKILCPKIFSQKFEAGVVFSNVFIFLAISASMPLQNTFKKSVGPKQQRLGFTRGSTRYPQYPFYYSCPNLGIFLLDYQSRCFFTTWQEDRIRILLRKCHKYYNEKPTN